MTEPWINCVGEGWYDICREIDVQLKAIDPNYQVSQIKEKFGGLRYYYTPSDATGAVDWEKMRAIVSKGEEQSYTICEECGNPGEPQTGGRYWVRTLCAPCNKVSEQRRKDRWKRVD